MFGILIQGILLGFTIAVLVGPAFFTLIQTSIHRGFKSGVFLAIGIFLSDLTLILVISLFTLGIFGAFDSIQFLLNPTNKIYFAFIGGIILIVFGVFTFTRSITSFSNNDDDENNGKKPGYLTFILKGFFLNIANPILIIFWMGVTSGVISGAEPGTKELLKHFFTFFTGALVTIFSTDILKCFIANKIKSYLNPKILVIINHTIGVLLVIFGIVIILRVVVFKSV